MTDQGKPISEKISETVAGARQKVAETLEAAKAKASEVRKAARAAGEVSRAGRGRQLPGAPAGRLHALLPLPACFQPPWAPCKTCQAQWQPGRNLEPVPCGYPAAAANAAATQPNHCPLIAPFVHMGPPCPSPLPADDRGRPGAGPEGHSGPHHD